MAVRTLRIAWLRMLLNLCNGLAVVALVADARLGSLEQMLVRRAVRLVTEYTLSRSHRTVNPPLRECRWIVTLKTQERCGRNQVHFTGKAAGLFLPVTVRA